MYSFEFDFMRCDPGRGFRMNFAFLLEVVFYSQYPFSPFPGKKTAMKRLRLNILMFFLFFFFEEEEGEKEVWGVGFRFRIRDLGLEFE